MGMMFFFFRVFFFFFLRFAATTLSNLFSGLLFLFSGLPLRSLLSTMADRTAPVGEMPSRPAKAHRTRKTGRKAEKKALGKDGFL